MSRVDRDRDRTLVTGEVGLERARRSCHEVGVRELLAGIDVVRGNQSTKRAGVGDLMVVNGVDGEGPGADGAV